MNAAFKPGAVPGCSAGEPNRPGEPPPGQIGTILPDEVVGLCEISFRTMAKVFPFSALATSDLVIDAVYEGGTKGNTADDVLGKLISGAGNQGGFRAVGSRDAPRLVICMPA